MIPYEKALELIDLRTAPLGAQEVPTIECGGRVLAEEVIARIPSPPFNKSAMDGYAVRSADVRELPAKLKLVGESLAGGWPDFAVGPGQCAAIATGAPVPEGADTVVMVEHTERLENGVIRVERLSGANICAQGEDVQEGDVVLKPGQLLTPLEAGVAAAAGYARLKVSRKPSVALVCTGTEVKEPGEKISAGQIFNSNAYLLAALLEPEAREFHYLGIVGDDTASVKAAIEKGLESDVLIISGGVSVGPFDLVPDALAAVGVETVFHKVAIKPGMPVFFGRRGGAHVFGMPGNPLSCFVVFHILVRRAFARMTGWSESPPFLAEGRLTRDVRTKGGRRTFRPCHIEAKAGQVLLTPAEHRGSADITGAADADGFFVVPGDVSQVDEGEIVEFFEVQRK